LIRRFKKRQDHFRFYRINERIPGFTFRVLDSTGKQIGVMSRTDTLRLAREKGVDLVEIAAKATPPVVKIINFKKFLYQESKKKKEEKKKSKISETKELRLGPFMNDHDLQVMIKRGNAFLEDNDKVRLVVKFIGRQIAHPEFGKDILQKVINALSDISKIERDPHFEGKQLIAILSPERSSKGGSAKKYEKENKELGEQKI